MLAGVKMKVSERVDSMLAHVLMYEDDLTIVKNRIYLTLRQQNMIYVYQLLL